MYIMVFAGLFSFSKIESLATYNSNGPLLGGDVIFTDDVSFEVFLDHLQRRSIQQNTITPAHANVMYLSLIFLFPFIVQECMTCINFSCWLLIKRGEEGGGESFLLGQDS